MADTAKLKDAQMMQRRHPDTFEAPSKQELNDIFPGDLIKVTSEVPGLAVEGERFWCEVEGRTPKGPIDCVVDNELMYSDKHGYEYMQRIEVKERNVYDIMKGEWAEQFQKRPLKVKTGVVVVGALAVAGLLAYFVSKRKS